jgi:hypothetical protein
MQTRTFDQPTVDAEHAVHRAGVEDGGVGHNLLLLRAVPPPPFGSPPRQDSEEGIIVK